MLAAEAKTGSMPFEVKLGWPNASAMAIGSG